MSRTIFINYRRKDAGGYAHSLFDRLKTTFGDGNVILDVAGAIPAGHSFPTSLLKSIAASDVMLSVVGPDWIAALTRPTDEDDYVVKEIAAAMALKRDIIPVLVGGAQMPAAAALPKEIGGFAHYQAVELRPNSYDAGYANLTKALEALTPVQLPEPGQRRCRLLSGILGLALAAALAGLAYLWVSTRDFSPDFFRTDRNIYDSIRADYDTLKSENVAVEKIVYVRFLTPEHQVGIHAYLGVQRGPKNGDGWIETRISSATHINQKDVDWFQWNGTTPPSLSGTSREGDNPNRIIVRPGAQSSFAIMKYYPDPTERGDHFHFTLSGGDAGGSSPVIENYVAVPRKYLDVFDVNRYLFDLAPCRWCSREVSINFSTVSFRPVDASTEKVRPARDLLSKLLAIKNCPWDKARCSQNYDPVKRVIAEIFDGGSFHSDVAVFHFTTKPRQDLVLLYRFCAAGKDDCL